MRQSPADDALVEVLEELRPWQASDAVDQALRGWAHERGVVLSDAADVAHHLRLLGQYDLQHIKQRGCSDASLDREGVASIAAFMLDNVAQGRGATDYDGMTAVPVKARTRRQYRKDFGFEATTEWLRSHVEYPAKLRQLIVHDVSEMAARRWIQRHPDEWPACTQPRDNSSMPWRFIRRRCRSLAEFQRRHFSRDWPTPAE